MVPGSRIYFFTGYSVKLPSVLSRYQYVHIAVNALVGQGSDVTREARFKKFIPAIFKNPSAATGGTNTIYWKVFVFIENLKSFFVLFFLATADS